MITRVVGRGRTEPLDRDDFAALRRPCGRVAVDVGTGDGRFPYHLAATDPDQFVVGIDPLDEPMGETAAKAARKPAKGGRPNLALVRASIEALPEELVGIADHIYVQLPWGRLLEGIVLADEAVIGGLAALGRSGARLSVTLNGEMWVDSTPARYAALPVPTVEYVAEVVAPGFAQVGLSIGPARLLAVGETKELPTTWARKLGHGRPHPRFVRFDGVADS
ncbi:MAG: rRNA methyltransferase [Actinomycetota bacterium]|nr:rRNA methyltransferase [Actinomycetota bacterium]